MRPGLVVKEIYQAGVLSLIIVLMSGMFIGMVLALQDTKRWSASRATESMGVLVALSLVRELGPVVAALLFASRAGLRDDGGDRPDENNRAAVGDGSHGGRSDCSRGGTAVLGGRHLAAIIGCAVLHRAFTAAIWLACA